MECLGPLHFFANISSRPDIQKAVCVSLHPFPALQAQVLYGFDRFLLNGFFMLFKGFVCHGLIYISVAGLVPKGLFVLSPGLYGASPNTSNRLWCVIGKQALLRSELTVPAPHRGPAGGQHGPRGTLSSAGEQGQPAGIAGEPRRFRRSSVCLPGTTARFSSSEPTMTHPFSSKEKLTARSPAPFATLADSLLVFFSFFSSFLLLFSQVFTSLQEKHYLVLEVQPILQRVSLPLVSLLYAEGCLPAAWAVMHRPINTCLSAHDNTQSCFFM